MGMENIMKALMQSAMESQSPSGSQQQAGGDMLSQVLGGLMGGGQQAPASQQSAGGDMLSQALGGILGGGAQGANQGDQMLGMLEQVIGGRPGTGQPLQMNQGTAANMAANMGGMGMGMGDPVMMMLQPVVNQVAAKANISPQIATVVASIAVHYLLSSHPSTSNQAPMNLGNVMQQLASSGGINQATLQKSGMVNDVVQATGLNQQDAMGSLNAVFNMLGGHVQGK